MKTETINTVRLENSVVFIDNIIYHQSEQLNFDSFSKEIYTKLQLSYPKFFKMDNLSKLCFLSVELILQEVKQSKNWNADKVAIVMANKNSSMDQDLKHFESIRNREDYFPSPSIFVYTLPNIMLGELCIRHQITGENSCFLMDKINPGFLYRYVYDLFENDHYRYCITGWVDYCDKAYEANLFLIEKRNGEKSYISDFNEYFYNVIAN